MALVIDDLHWADDQLAVDVQALVHRLGGRPALVLLSTRPSPRSTEVDVLVEDVAGRGDRLLLSPLSD